jgi:hypothetical protein
LKKCCSNQLIQKGRLKYYSDGLSIKFLLISIQKTVQIVRQGETTKLGYFFGLVLFQIQTKDTPMLMRRIKQVVVAYLVQKAVRHISRKMQQRR